VGLTHLPFPPPNLKKSKKISHQSHHIFYKFWAAGLKGQRRDERGGGVATHRHSLSTCQPDGAPILLEEDAATVTKILFVRLITKGCKIIVYLFVG
jgi:hypothetical protein